MRRYYCVASVDQLQMPQWSDVWRVTWLYTEDMSCCGTNLTFWPSLTQQTSSIRSYCQWSTSSQLTDMLQSSPVKPSAAPTHPSGTVVTDPTLRLMAAAAARSAGRPDLTPRPSIAAAVAANELYASLFYSQQHQLDRAAMLMHQHHSHFSHLPPASSQRTQTHASQPRQAHTGGFALPQYQSSQSHPHHLIQAPGPAAAAAFESYSQSLATLSQLSQRLQVHSSPHSRMPAPPTALTVDPYLAAAAAAAHGGRASSPASKRQSPSQTPVSDTPRHRNPYEFCDSETSPGVRYQQDDMRCHRRHHRHHHHHQRDVQPDDVCRDENHNAFQRRDKRQEVTSTHAQTALPLTAEHDDGDTTGKTVDARTVTGNGNDVMCESPSGSELLLGTRRSTGGSRHGRYERESDRDGADFTHGSRIQLSDGRIKRIEDMRTEDFVLSSSSVGVAGGRDVTSSQLVLVSSRVVHIRLNHDTSSAILGFVVDSNIHSPVRLSSLHCSSVSLSTLTSLWCCPRCDRTYDIRTLYFR